MLFRETQDQWHVFIQDAILEKCSEKGAAIVHISVDKTSNEVSVGLFPHVFYLINLKSGVVIMLSVLLTNK